MRGEGLMVVGDGRESVFVTRSSSRSITRSTRSSSSEFY